ncbi:uncharacterized protein PRCAT00003421001 [Priceomyces carsonii]|uniref:uncharacterized protein n=1 Tax=Priceomyces carsonii TaxID=28549 RepID=UPI002EDB42EF|nr:unnamed protein product [Priceomyces carsonii]
MFKSVFRTGIRSSYDVLENPLFSSDAWKVYPAKHRSLGRAVSVFIFDKSKFESQIHRMCLSMSSNNPKVVISNCYELIKYEVTQLSKLKHPQILTVFETLEETKLKFLFATEPVKGSLVTTDLAKLDNLSIQKGLLEIAKSLQFLHNYCSIIHFNLQPSSVFINTQGDWKLAGFRFLKDLKEILPLERLNFFLMHNSSLVPFSNLNVNYTAPELLIDKQLILDPGNDIWSLGCLIFYLYNKGEAILNCFDTNSISDYKSEFKRFENKFYNHRPSELRYFLKNVPDKLYPLFPQILARYPNERITIDQFIDSDFFQGNLIRAMLFIDEISTKTLEEKTIFTKGLSEADSEGNSLISQFPDGFNVHKLLPLLIDLITKELNLASNRNLDTLNELLITNSLTVVFKIGSTLSRLTFQDVIYESLLKDEVKSKVQSVGKKLLNCSVRTRMTLIENLEVLESKLNDRLLIDLAKKLSDLALNSPVDTDNQEDQIKLQEVYFKKLPGVAGKFDFPYIKNNLFPLICQVFKTTTLLSVKVLIIENLEMLVSRKIIDKIIVEDQILPLLKNLKSRDKRIVAPVLKFFVNLNKSDHITLSIETSVDFILCQSLLLVFGCHGCTQEEFSQFMSYTRQIETALMDRNIENLPKSSSQTTKSGDMSFSKVISGQNLTEGKKDDILKVPKTKNILQPIRTQSDSQQGRKTQLSFGSTGSSSQNASVLRTLRVSNDNRDDKPRDNEAPKLNPAFNIKPQSNFQQLQLGSNSPSFPPGFNSHLILSPSNKTSNTNGPKKSSDIFDLI